MTTRALPRRFPFTRSFIGIALLVLPVSAAPVAPDEPMSLWFTRPAATYHESSPFGNGRLGAMDFGGIDEMRVVLNESSVWSGGPYDANNHEAHRILPDVRRMIFGGDLDGAARALKENFGYPEGVKGWWDTNQFGCYQIMADLYLRFPSSGRRPLVSSPTGHAAGDKNKNAAKETSYNGLAPGAFHSTGDDHTIHGATDGKPTTKWCVDNAGSAVAWQVSLPEPAAVADYTLTSADDMPSRDPQEWTLEGSEDGKTWTKLDQRVLPGPFAKRHEAKSFTIAKPATFRHYKFTFVPKDPYFQIGEIALGGMDMLTREKVPEDYRRDVNLMTGLGTTRFSQDGVTYTREVVASKPDEVIFIRLSADRPGALTFDALLSRRENVKVLTDGGLFILDGQLPFNRPGGGGVGTRFATVLGVAASGGKSTTTATGIRVEKADAVTLTIGGATNLHGGDAMEKARSAVTAAMARPADAVVRDATADHAALMSRVALQLPAGAHAGLPTPERVLKNEGAPDPSLAALYFQFGRYLMVAGSRADSPLPTNLQGIWADEYSTPWRGDFHTNINLQMNYWPAEAVNLAECHLPLMRFLEGMAKEGARTAKAYFNAPGWVAYHTQNPWFETAPSHLPASAGPTCGAWLVQHVWTHYEFTRDKEFLKTYYPLLRGAAEFCQAVLIEDPKSKFLVTVPSSSPENSYAYVAPDGKKARAWLCAGSTYDMQIMRGLFLATAEAARLLGVDAEFAGSLDATRARLAPTRLGTDGRILEWQEEFEEVEVHHRHCSHLWGLFPGTEISDNTPELLAGARKSLETRGDASTGWSMAWKACFWARLKDGDRADRLLSMLIGRGAPNLFCLHPPFQIDGNFGGCAAVAEMLVQSHDGTIALLPAVPKAWNEGSVRGLRARGNVTVDIAWKDGQITGYRLTSPEARKVKVKINGKVEEVATVAP